MCCARGRAAVCQVLFHVVVSRIASLVHTVVGPSHVLHARIPVGPSLERILTLFKYSRADVVLPVLRFQSPTRHAPRTVRARELDAPRQNPVTGAVSMDPQTNQTCCSAPLLVYYYRHTVTIPKRTSYISTRERNTSFPRAGPARFCRESEQNAITLSRLATNRHRLIGWPPT